MQWQELTVNHLQSWGCEGCSSFSFHKNLNRVTCPVIAPPCYLALTGDLKVRAPHRICQLLSRVDAGPDLLQGNLPWETSVSPKWEMTKTHEGDQNLKPGKAGGTLMFMSALSGLGYCRCCVWIHMQINLLWSVEQVSMNLHFFCSLPLHWFVVHFVLCFQLLLWIFKRL